MASNKPQIKAYIEPEIYLKFKKVAEKKNRSISNLIEYLAIKEVEQYEAEHGEIKID